MWKTIFYLQLVDSENVASADVKPQDTNSQPYLLKETHV